MNLLILHLSDMHFKKSKNYEKSNIVSIVNALQQSMIDVNHILIVISGDLTYSGKKGECIQVNFFLSGLKDEIFNRYKVSDVQFAIVPGNHDVDYEMGDIGRTGLELLEKNNSYKDEINHELKKQGQFYILANKYDCFPETGLLHQKYVEYGDSTIQINLINTAVFSSIEEDQGFHYIEETDIKELSNNNSDYVITVMHHPHHWYSYHCKKAFEEALYSRSDLIFVGHEHYESSMKIEQAEASVSIIAAGKLSDRGDWYDSEFHVVVLNLETRDCISRKYNWNANRKIYEEKEDVPISLSKNRYNQLGLIVRPDFSKKLDEDKYCISNSVRDYFVFPLLVEENMAETNGIVPKEINSMEEFIGSLGSQEKIVISGSSDSGKSVLSRAIYAELASHRVTLFVKGSDVGNDPERTIRDAFEDAYSKEKVDYEAFKQTKPEDLAIVIDDVDTIDPSREETFINYVATSFGVIVETCQTEIEVDIKRRLKKRANTRNYTFYRIEPFYSDKRKELVSSIVRLISNSDLETQEHVIDLLCDVLTKQKYLYSWNPEFIVQFVRYYCNNIGEAAQNDGNVFSKVFEANLTQLIKPYARNISVDKVLVVLDKIAYCVFVMKLYPIQLADIDGTIHEYNSVYGSKIDTNDFLSLLTAAKIMKKTDGGYKFYDRNYLAYFTAREIKRRCLEDGDYSQLNHIMEYSYSSINADILLFVTYITENINVIRMVMDQGVKAVDEWKEFSLENNDIAFLVKPVNQVVKPFEAGDREKVEAERIQQEKAEAQSVSNANDSTIFIDETEELNYVQKIIRSISLMIILARTLPSFEHLMKKEDKERCVDMLYKMPLKIFEAWAKAIDEESNVIVEDIKQFHEREFRNEKPHYQPLDDEEALKILKWEATSLLLDLMLVVMNYSTRNNTNDFIDSFDYELLPAYSVEHLIGLSIRDSVDAFSSEAIRVFSDYKQPMTKNMVQRVAKRYMVNSRRIKSSDIQRLNAKIFNQQLPQDRILIEQHRNRGKK